METEPSPRCPNCGQTLRLMRVVSYLCHASDLQVFECTDCDISLVDRHSLLQRIGQAFEARGLRCH
jgi:transposase-like protein